MLQAGSSVQVITPPLGHPLVGFFHRREAATVADDLTARALVLDDGSTRMAIVVCDLLSLKSDLVESIRSLIEAECSIPRTNVMVSCTHTHSGPATSRHRGDDPDPAYIESLVQRIADGVRIAQTRLQPARIATGRAPVAGVCFNRRYHMADGTVRFNPGVNNPDVIGPAGPVDPEVVALLVESADGVPLALWSCLSTHYAGTDDELAISADYYGYYAAAIARSLGDQCIGLHANGTSGDINTIDIAAPNALHGTAKAIRVGDAVAATAIQAVLAQPRQDDVALGARSERCLIERWSVTPDDIATAIQLLEMPQHTEPLPAGTFSYLVGQPIPAYQIVPYAQGVLHVAELPAQSELEVHVLRIGDLALVGLPGEVFVEFGLTLKDRSPFAHTAVVGLANGAVGYLPTEAGFDQGAYESWRSEWSWTNRGTGERLTERAATLLDQVAASKMPLLVAQQKGAVPS
jgi:hypothetical protein